MAVGCTVGIAASAAAALAYTSCKLQSTVGLLKEDIASLRDELHRQSTDKLAERTNADADASTKIACAADADMTALEEETNDALDELTVRLPTLWPACQGDGFVDGEPVMEAQKESNRAADIFNFPSLMRERDSLCNTFHNAALAHSEAEMLAASAKLGSSPDFHLPGMSSSSTTLVREATTHHLSQEEELHLLRSQLHQAVSRQDLLALRCALDHALAYGMEPTCLASELAYCEELAKQRECRVTDFQVAEALQNRQYAKALELVVDCSLAHGTDAFLMKKTLTAQVMRLTNFTSRDPVSLASTTWGGASFPVRLGSTSTLHSDSVYLAPLKQHYRPQDEQEVRPALSPRNATRGIPPPPSQHVPPPMAPSSGDMEEMPAFATIAREESEVWEVITSRDHGSPRINDTRTPKPKFESRENTVTLPADEEHEGRTRAGGMKLHSSAPHAAMLEVKNLSDDDLYYNYPPAPFLRMPIGAFHETIDDVVHEGRAYTEPTPSGAGLAPRARVPHRSPRLTGRHRPDAVRVVWS